MKKLWLILVIFAFLLPFAIYAFTLAPVYIPIDSAEFTMCMHWWGVCHPPGFPLFTLLGHIFLNIVPFGTIAFRANLFSAFWAAATIFVVYLTLLRLKADRINAFLVVMVFALNSVFWEFALAADVFSFGTFLVATFFFLVFLKRYYFAVLVLGLSTSHFYITAILAPVLYWYFWGFDVKNNFFLHIGRLALSSVIFILGLSPQLLMYMRMQEGLPINWGHAQGLEGFWYFIRRQEFGSIFLIANPVLTFSPIKVFGQVSAFLYSLFTTFAVILVLVVPISVIFKDVRRRNFFFIVLCFILITLVQLFLLGTLGAPSEDNPFQLNKFYLVSFLVFILAAGISVETVSKRLFGESSLLRVIFGLVIIILFLSNITTLNYSKNHFSENFIFDSMSGIEPGSLVLTVSHIMYFGARYEQEVNGKFDGITFLYFPNEYNRDSEKYNPQILKGEQNMEFVEKVQKGKNIGNAESYVLSIISRNLDKSIYILQGSFEEGFFSYLKPYLRPHGLMWRLEVDITKAEDIYRLLELYSGWGNEGLKYSDLHLKQQRHDLAGYGVAYNTMAVYLATLGKYSEAAMFFNKAVSIQDSPGARDSLDVINRILDLEDRYDTLVGQKDLMYLEELGDKLIVIGNFKRCVDVESEILRFREDPKYYVARGLCLANLGEIDLARENYTKALEIDANYTDAKRALEQLGD